jgi:hypothetical protein
MNDADGPAVAKDFYSELLKNDGFSASDIPYALDSTVQNLRRRGAPPERWATFVHMGA